MYFALCEGTYDEIYAIADTEKEALRLLFNKVKRYLKDRQAPETSEMSVAELKEYFGYVIVPIKSGTAGFLKS